MDDLGEQFKRAFEEDKTTTFKPTALDEFVAVFEIVKLKYGESQLSAIEMLIKLLGFEIKELKQVNKINGLYTKNLIEMQSILQHLIDKLLPELNPRKKQ